MNENGEQSNREDALVGQGLPFTTFVKVNDELRNVSCAIEQNFRVLWRFFARCREVFTASYGSLYVGRAHFIGTVYCSTFIHSTDSFELFEIAILTEKMRLERIARLTFDF